MVFYASNKGIQDQAAGPVNRWHKEQKNSMHTMRSEFKALIIVLVTIADHATYKWEPVNIQ